MFLIEFDLAVLLECCRNGRFPLHFQHNHFHNCYYSFMFRDEVDFLLQRIVSDKMYIR